MTNATDQKPNAEATPEKPGFGDAFEAKVVAWFEAIRSHKFWGRATEPRTIWEASSSLFHWLYTAGSRLIWVIVVVVVGGIIYLGLARQTTVIAPLSVPSTLADQGFTAEVAAHRLRDAVTRYIEGVNSRMRNPVIALRGDLPNLVVPSVGISLDAVIKSVSTLLRSTRSRTVGGEITAVSDGKAQVFSLRLRLDGKEIPIGKKEVAIGELDALFDHAVEGLLKEIKPYFVGAKLVRDMLNSEGEDKHYKARQAMAFVDEMIEELKPIDPKKQRFADPDLAWFYNLQGLIFKSRGDQDSAIKALQTAVWHNKNLTLAYVNLAAIYQVQAITQKSLGKFKEAKQKFQLAKMEILHARALRPDVAVIHNNYADLLHTMASRNRKSDDKAIEEACRAIAIEKAYGAGHFTLAEILRDNARAEEAIAHFDAAQRHDPRLAKKAQSEIKMLVAKIATGSTPKTIRASIQHPHDRAGDAGRQDAGHDRLAAQGDDIAAPFRRHYGQACKHDAEGAEIGEAADGIKHDQP